MSAADVESQCGGGALVGRSVEVGTPCVCETLEKGRMVVRQNGRLWAAVLGVERDAGCKVIAVVERYVEGTNT